ncbi:MAG: iron-containing alcohol dehydrogenase [Pseudomonadota bacterium]
MTLINFLTRVHFADNVLEDALHSEMERHSKRRPFVVAEDAHVRGPIAERFFSSFPIRTRAQTFSAVTTRATETAAREIAERYRTSDCDVLIAFGSNRAMDLAKVARVAIAYDEPIAALSREEGGAQRITPVLPDLYSVPGILGFASAITDYTRVKLDTGGQVMLSSPHLIPTVTICDPSLAIGSSRAESAIAAAGVLARGIDGFLAPAYNPPADALALDALGRVAANVHRVLRDDDLGCRREMMAAGLNSSLALQKGLCAVHAISNAVAAVSRAPIDPSALGGILIPELARTYAARSEMRLEAVSRSLGLPDGQPLWLGLQRLMDRLPLVRTLDAFGIAADDLPAAAELAARDRALGNAPVPLRRDAVLDILNTVHGSDLQHARRNGVRPEQNAIQ